MAKNMSATTKTKRNIAIVVLVVVIVIAAVVGYYYTLPPAPAKTVRIGVMAPLSPPGDFKSGEMQVNMYKLAVKQANEAGGILGGRLIEIVGPYDDEGRPEVGATVAEKLVLEQQVPAMVGGWHSSVGLAQANVAAKYGVPVVNPASWTDEISLIHNDYVFKLTVGNFEFAFKSIPFIQHMAWKRIVFFAEDTDYGIGQARDTKLFLDQIEYPYEYYEEMLFPYDAVDFKATLLKIKEMKPDVVIIAAVYDAMYLIPRQAYEVGLYDMSDIVIGWDYPGWSPDWWEICSEGGVAAYFPSMYDPKMLTESGLELKRLAKEEYGYEEISIYHIWAYDAMRVVIDAINRAGTDQPEAIMKALKETKFPGCTGTIAFDTDTDRHPAIYNKYMGIDIWWYKYTEVGQSFDQATLVFAP